jgi:hypothetical protein
MKLLIVFTIAFQIPALSHPGVGIVQDTRGNVFYTDLVQVWMIPVNGQKRIVVNNVHTHELYIDERNNLFGEHLWYDDAHDQWMNYAWKYSADGKFEKVIPDAKGFITNYSFVRDHQGNMFWADRDNKDCQKVVRADKNHQMTKFSDPCFKNIRWMNANADGTLYIVDFQDLKKIDKSGKIRTVASQIADKKVKTSTIENQNSVMGVWDDAAGNLYAAVYSNREVKKFSPTGQELKVIKFSDSWGACGGFVDAKGAIWLLETSTANLVRVEKIELDGKRTVY